MTDFAKARVVVVGDGIIDRWIYGRVERISPEAPVPVFIHERQEDRPGGAFNVGANLEALGCQPTVLTDLAIPSPLKERYIASGQQLFRCDREQIREIDPHVARDIFRQATASPLIGALVLSDYGKGVLLGNLPALLIEWARGFNIPVIADPKQHWKRYAGATVVTPNLAELGDDQPDYLRGIYGFDAVLVTKGAAGMTLHASDGALDIPATAREVFDVCGAGDSVVAVLAAALAVGYPLPEAARLANAAAGVVVSKSGTATCSLAELEAAL